MTTGEGDPAAPGGQPTEEELRAFEQEFRTLRKRGLSEKKAAQSAAEKATKS